MTKTPHEIFDAGDRFTGKDYPQRIIIVCDLADVEYIRADIAEQAATKELEEQNRIMRGELEKILTVAKHTGLEIIEEIARNILEREAR